MEERDLERLWRVKYLESQSNQMLDSLATCAKELRQVADQIDRGVAQARADNQDLVALVAEVANKVTWVFPNLGINRI